MHIIYPIVNLNGDSKQTLLDQLISCHQSLQEAQEKFYAAMPHGRNYQTCERNVYYLARTQHDNWIKKLTAIQKDIMELYNKIAEQGK